MNLAKMSDKQKFEIIEINQQKVDMKHSTYKIAKNFHLKRWGKKPIRMKTN